MGMPMYCNNRPVVRRRGGALLFLSSRGSHLAFRNPHYAFLCFVFFQYIVVGLKSIYRVLNTKIQYYEIIRYLNGIVFVSFEYAVKSAILYVVLNERSSACYVRLSYWLLVFL